MKYRIFLILAFFLIIGIVIYSTYQQTTKCKEVGGLLVRGIAGWECVEVIRK